MVSFEFMLQLAYFKNNVTPQQMTERNDPNREVRVDGEYDKIMLQ